MTRPPCAPPRLADRATTAIDVVDDFGIAARAWPGRTAVVHNGIPTTYRELAARVATTASRYRTAAPGRIGVMVSHDPAAAEHLLAVLACGATYCPIDATLPPARRRAIATALDVDHLVAAEPPAVGLGSTVLQHERYSCAPAYVLCTSGSTGMPKPVAVSRPALAVTVRALRQLFGLTPEDRVLQFASLGWDTCLEEILPTLTSGAALVFDNAAHCGSFPPFLRMLAAQGVTVLDVPTAFWHELVLHLHDEHAELPECVRLVVIGGERVDPTRLRQWRDLDAGRTRLLNTYGCTETTMITHAVQLSGPGTEPGVARCADAPLGRPLPHVHHHITGDGELMVSGPGIATGYPGLPDKTAAAFPVADHGTGTRRWFRTGDLVHPAEDGLLHPLGRTDEQVKVLGVRVHPAEVEAQLTSHPAVSGAVVVGEHALGRTVLTAYVVAAAPTTAADLKRYLRDRLPSQFVPTRMNFVATLAYTASGKVDRAATRRAAANSNNKGACR
ncbi:AMP-binding protein [Mycolicibacterium sp.]|uniref:AMP-binding protein n=1 Tax=Mycolicibacterium sp. TaxID=2320850 RepID=UPI003D0E966A